MVVTYGDKTLLETITFLSLGDGETKIAIGADGEKLSFVFNFVTDATAKETGYKPELIDDKTLKMTLTNWANPLGTGIVAPVEVGVFRKQKLYLVFFVAKAGQKGTQRLVTVSFYLGGGANG